MSDLAYWPIHSGRHHGGVSERFYPRFSSRNGLAVAARHAGPKAAHAVEPNMTVAEPGFDSAAGAQAKPAATDVSVVRAGGRAYTPAFQPTTGGTP